MPAFIVSEFDGYNLVPVICEKVNNLAETRPLVSLFVKMVDDTEHSEIMEEWDRVAQQDVCTCGRPECGNVVMPLMDAYGAVVLTYAALA